MTQEQANWEWIDARVKKLEEHCFSIKTLTDEEILSLWMQKNTLGGAQNIVDFARAILKKASEK